MSIFLDFSVIVAMAGFLESRTKKEEILLMKVVFSCSS
jgi:hypothetical protein